MHSVLFFVFVRLSELSMAKGVVRRRPKPKEKGSDSEVPQFKYLYSYAQAAPPACTFEPNGLSLVTV